MKLKYYLRGIGVGLILAVVIYSTMIIPRKYRVTDEEVRKRAQELGMVQKEEPDVDLSALSGTPSPDGAMTPSATGELTPGADVTGEAQETPDKPTPPTGPASPTGMLTPTPAPTPSASPQPTEADAPQEGTTSPEGATSAPQATSTPIAASTAPELGSGNKVQVTVTYGMGSEDFSRELYRVGLIDDAAAFDQYLMKNGYALSIRVGTYSIPEGATYSEIAKIVTGRSD